LNASGVWAGQMSILFDVGYLNSAPILAPLPDVTVAVGETLRTDINTKDPDGHMVMLSTSLPGATFEGSTLVWTATMDDAGVTYPDVTATDVMGAATEVRFRLTVSVGNSVPTISVDDDEVEAEEGEVVYVPVFGSDPDGDVLSYHLASPDKGFSIDRATGLLTFDANGREPGVYRATVVVTDGMVSAERVVEVTVEGPGSAPVLWLLLGGVLLLAVAAVLLPYRK